MNTRRTLDHDGLDGITPPRKKPKSIYYVVLIGFLFVGILLSGLFIFRPEWLDFSSQTVAQPESETGVQFKKTDFDSHASVVEFSEAGQRVKTEAVSVFPVITDAPESESGLQGQAVVGKTQSTQSHQTESVQSDDNRKNGVPVSTDSGRFTITVLFDFASSSVKGLTNTQKQRLTHFIDNCHNEISIIGHTCNIGSQRSNRLLGLARAKNMSQYLVKQGVDENSIVIFSDGQDHPIASNATESGRQLNRRVELHCRKDS